MRPVYMEKDGSKAREGRNLTGFNRRATRLDGMQQPSNPVVILAQAPRGRLSRLLDSARLPGTGETAVDAAAL